MQVDNKVYILDEKEIMSAIYAFIEGNIDPPIKCLGDTKFETDRKTGKILAYQEAYNVRLDPLEVVKDRSYYCLRHIDTGLFLVGITIDKKNNLSYPSSISPANSMRWRYSSEIISSLKTTATANSYNEKAKNKILDGLRDDLLQFQIVKFGEIEVEDLTFHIDQLAKL